MVSLASNSGDAALPPQTDAKKGKQRAQAKASNAPTLPLFANDSEEDSHEESEAPPAKQSTSHYHSQVQDLVTLSGQDPWLPPPPINLHTKPCLSGPNPPEPIINAPTHPNQTSSKVAHYKALQARNAGLPPPSWLPAKPTQQSKRPLVSNIKEEAYNTPGLTNIPGQMQKYEGEQQEARDKELKDLQDSLDVEQKHIKATKLYWEKYSRALAEPPTKKWKLGESVPGQQAHQSRLTAPLPYRTSVEAQQVPVPPLSRTHTTPTPHTAGGPRALPPASNTVDGPSRPCISTFNVTAGPSKTSATNATAASSEVSTHPLLNLKDMLKPKK
ncbi:hypothetical protein V5O48_015366 [Marasmius crinis-equi]|uniref:Uncharacterized protein n=1 Tax=Marasmius crinis-equi TaxID=585013 RepID=A0ABR3EUQ2_9AGAR